jgi:hypothetical protein
LILWAKEFTGLKQFTNKRRECVKIKDVKFLSTL